jgi:endonuclease/exonuclease/phosphatase family metal-dependent hydrolase
MKKRKLLGAVNLIAVAVISICITFTSPAWAENPDLEVKVMTRNMYMGAELGLLATAGDEQQLAEKVSIVLHQAIESRIPDRAALIAAEIARTRPDLVALQEATLWTIETESGSFILDQLDDLMDSLKASGLHYRVAVDQELANLEMPGVASYTDRDVILVRSDLPPGHLKILGTETHKYENYMGFPVLDNVVPAWRGWIAVDVKIRGARFKFVNTHLEAPIDGVPQTQLLQVAQAMELVEDLKATSLPIILVGDFNSDAEPTLGTPADETYSYYYILGSGYDDAWHELRPADHGYSWPLFMESPQAGEGVVPVERIDLIFSNGFEATSIARTGVNPVHGLFASDHAGMVAEFSLTNHRPDKPKEKPCHR